MATRNVTQDFVSGRLARFCLCLPRWRGNRPAYAGPYRQAYRLKGVRFVRRKIPRIIRTASTAPRSWLAWVVSRQTMRGPRSAQSVANNLTGSLAGCCQIGRPLTQWRCFQYLRQFLRRNRSGRCGRGFESNGLGRRVATAKARIGCPLEESSDVTAEGVDRPGVQTHASKKVRNLCG